MTALCPAGNVRAFEVPPEYADPPAVALADKVEKTEWYTPTSYLEAHRVTATIFGPGAAAAGRKNPADALADAVEAAVDWTQLGIAGSRAIGFKRETRGLAAAAGRTDNAGRVFRVEVVWLVNLWTGP